MKIKFVKSNTISARKFYQKLALVKKLRLQGISEGEIKKLILEIREKENKVK